MIVLYANLLDNLMILGCYLVIYVKKKITFAQRESLVWRFETTKSEFYEKYNFI